MKFLCLLVLIPLALALPIDENPVVDPVLDDLDADETLPTGLPLFEESTDENETDEGTDDETVPDEDEGDNAIEEDIENDEATEAPETEAPETEAPETEAPETEAPEIEAPETEAPETEESATESEPEIENSEAAETTSATEAVADDEAATTEAPVDETTVAPVEVTDAVVAETTEASAPETVSVRTALHTKWTNEGRRFRGYSLHVENKSDRDICSVTVKLTGKIHDIANLIQNEDGTFSTPTYLRVVPGAKSIEAYFHSAGKSSAKLVSVKYCDEL